MLLPIAILIGVVGAIVRSLYTKRPPTIPPLQLVWLVVASFLIQYIIFFLPSLHGQLPVPLTALGFCLSLFLLSIFALRNFKQSGFALLSTGLLLNLIVIVTNGGFMPISPDTISKLSIRQAYIDEFVVVGQQFAVSKDIVLHKSETWLWMLSDIFVIPGAWLWWRRIGVAFSIGDVLIAIGAIWFLWQSCDEQGDEHLLSRSLVTTE